MLVLSILIPCMVSKICFRGCLGHCDTTARLKGGLNRIEIEYWIWILKFFIWPLNKTLTNFLKPRVTEPIGYFKWLIYDPVLCIQIQYIDWHWKNARDYFRLALDQDLALLNSVSGSEALYCRAQMIIDNETMR